MAVWIAEVLLGEQRKNVWWVTWLFELRMKVIELLLFAAFDTSKEPIPVVDLHFAPRFTATEADRLLHDACRMVRLDVFRLARIVESYAPCVEAVTAHCDRDPDTRERLRERLDFMRQQCNMAWTELSVRHDRRKKLPSPKVDERITRYVDSVRDRVTSIVECSCARERIAWSKMDNQP